MQLCLYNIHWNWLLFTIHYIIGNNEYFEHEIESKISFKQTQFRETKTFIFIDIIILLS